MINDVDPGTSQVREFIFNGDNKQFEVKQNGVTIGRYFYDGEGKRVKKETNTETTIFVYSAGKLIAEYSTQLAAHPSTNYTTTDHLGTPRIITDELGQTKARRDFMPFGEELPNTVGSRSANAEYSGNQDEVRQKFTGYQKDTETSLDFAEARMYENRLGRFTAVDPLLASGKSANPQTFNRYIYVSNNPILLSDPTGLDPWWKGNCKDGRCSYREAKDKPTDGSWEAVTFNDRGYAEAGQWNDTGRTAYLYANGGQDFGTRASVAATFLRNAVADNNFCASSPQCLGLRNEEVRNATADVMAMGAAVLNTGPGSYNLFASGVNYFGGQLPYAPELSPDANSSSGQNLFFYGTNGAMAAQGGISLFRGVRNFFSLEGATNLASPARTAHILAGDGPLSGGHAWFRSWQSTKNGMSGAKDMFPITWSNRKIMTAISEVATSPSSTWIQQSGRAGTFFEKSGNPARFLVQGQYANRRISVVVQGSDIITAW